MAGKSTINRLPADVKAYLHKLLREDRHTLDDMLADLQARYPSQKPPSRSALSRFKVGFDQLSDKARQQRQMAEAFVGAFGEDASDKTGILLIEAISTLTYQAAMGAHEKDDVTITEICALARAAKATMEARTLSVKERQAIETATRQRLLQEQAAALDSAVKAKGMTEDQAQYWRQTFLGVKA